MGKLIVGAVGLVAGSLLGNPHAGLAAGLAIGSVLFPNRNTIEHNKASTLKISDSSYGQIIPYVANRQRVSGNMIWVARDANGNALQESVTVTNSKGSSTTNRHYSYSASFAIMVSEGTINGISKIIAEDTVIYDETLDAPTKYDIAIYIGNDTQGVDPTIEAWEGVNNAPAYRGRAYVVFTDFPLEQWGNRIPSFFFDVRGRGTNLADLTTNRLVASGIDEMDIDVEDLEPINIDGFIQNERTSISSLLPNTLEFYQSDLVEVNGKIVGVRRGGASIVNIPEGDLGADYDLQPKDRYIITREQDRELPQILNLTYNDIDNSYAIAVDQAIRQTYNYIQNTLNITIPVATTRNTASTAVHRILYSRWRSRTSYQFSLPLKYLNLTPADVVRVEIDGVYTRMRIVEINVDLLGKMDVRAVLDSEDNVSQSFTGGSGGVQMTGSVSLAEEVDTVFEVYSGKEFKDTHATRGGFYVVAAGVKEGWKGCTVYYSPDGGTNWIEAALMTQEGTFGHTWNALPAGVSPDTYDNTTILDVHINERKVLTSQSQIMVDNGKNSALFGTEISGFTTATAYGGDNYHLMGLKRGRRMSGLAGQGSFARFWLLDAAVRRIPVDDSLIGQTIRVKCPSFGQALSAVSHKNVTIATPTYPFAAEADLEWIPQDVLVSTNYTVPDFPRKTYCIVGKGANIITLPNATTWKRPIFIKAEGASVLVQRSGSATINGATSVMMSNSVNLTQPIVTQGYGGINTENTYRRELQLVSNGTNWVIVQETFAG